MTLPNMTLQSALREGQSILYYAEVESPTLDAMVLLAEAVGISKERLIASLPEGLNGRTYRRYRDLLDLRCSGRPVSYIRRKKEFYSLEFYVDQRVLVPRPETETLVDEALAVVRGCPGTKRVHDACTGSGCVPFALKRLLPELEISGSDISSAAGEVFRLNGEGLLGIAPPFYRSDLLQAVPGIFDLITANPPYLRRAEVEKMKKMGWPEPELALDGGREGTDMLFRLIGQARERLCPGGHLLLEADPEQMKSLASRLGSSGFSEITVTKDLAGRERVIRGRIL